MTRIKILYGEVTTWHKDFIGKEFIAELKIHSTFKYGYYVLVNCEHNRKHFYGTEDEELSLLFLRDGFTGVRVENVEVFE